jgi:hypothetical protein
MEANAVEAARAGLAEWAAESRENFDSVADVVGAPLAEAENDPLSVMPYLQIYIAEMPLDEFETDDWATLHADIVSFLTKVMIDQHGASWQVREAPNSPRGYRYVLRSTDAQGATHDVDPFEVVAQEFQRRPIEVARMLATMELSLGAAPVD